MSDDKGHITSRLHALDAWDMTSAWDLRPQASAPGSGRAAPFVMIPDGPEVMAVQATLKKAHASQIVAIRVPACPTAAARVVELTRDGAEVIHLVFDSHGREQGI